jgi:hypothetical protein
MAMNYAGGMERSSTFPQALEMTNFEVGLIKSVASIDSIIADRAALAPNGSHQGLPRCLCSAGNVSATSTSQ